MTLEKSGKIHKTTDVSKECRVVYHNLFELQYIARK